MNLAPVGHVGALGDSGGTRTPLDQLLARWRDEAQLLRAHGALEAAARCRATARQIILEAARRRWKSA